MTVLTEPVYKAEVFYGLTNVVEKFTTLEVCLLAGEKYDHIPKYQQVKVIFFVKLAIIV